MHPISPGISTVRKRAQFLATLSAAGIVCLLVSLLPAQETEVRTWRDASGKFSVVAELKSVDAKFVSLTKTDGRIIKVPLSSLSKADQQFLDSLNPPTPNSAAPQFGKPVTFRTQLGLKVVAQKGPCGRITCGFPFPIDWPEQKITIVEKNISANVRGVTTEVLQGGVTQVRFMVPKLSQGETAEVVFTVDIERKPILPPVDKTGLVLTKHPNSKLRKYLGASPSIELTHPAVRKEADKVELDATQTAWDQVLAIRDYTHERIEFSGIGRLKGALKGLAEGSGDCEERTSVFVALCRLKGIPARSVWIPGHAYAEFYLEDQSGNGFWFPCESVGKEFGEKPVTFMVLQKGDSFRDPLKVGLQRYITETVKGSARRGEVAPVLKPVLTPLVQQQEVERR